MLPHGHLARPGPLHSLFGLGTYSYQKENQELASRIDHIYALAPNSCTFRLKSLNRNPKSTSEMNWRSSSTLTFRPLVTLTCSFQPAGSQPGDFPATIFADCRKTWTVNSCPWYYITIIYLWRKWVTVFLLWWYNEVCGASEVGFLGFGDLYILGGLKGGVRSRNTRGRVLRVGKHVGSWLLVSENYSSRKGGQRTRDSLRCDLCFGNGMREWETLQCTRRITRSGHPSRHERLGLSIAEIQAIYWRNGQLDRSHYTCSADNALQHPRILGWEAVRFWWSGREHERESIFKRTRVWCCVECVVHGVVPQNDVSKGSPFVLRGPCLAPIKWVRNWWFFL